MELGYVVKADQARRRLLPGSATLTSRQDGLVEHCSDWRSRARTKVSAGILVINLPGEVGVEPWVKLSIHMEDTGEAPRFRCDLIQILLDPMERMSDLQEILRDLSKSLRGNPSEKADKESHPHRSLSALFSCE